MSTEEQTIPLTTMSFPTKMIVGPGALAKLPEEITSLGSVRVLLVSDPGLVKAGIVQRVEAVLDAANIGYARYLGVSKNPVENDVIEGVDCYHQSGASLIIGLGGGGPMDVAKAIRLKVTHPLPLAEYDDLKDGSEKISADQPPIITIPTTAGTGSEVGRSSVISLGSDGVKVVIFSPFMMPQVAILDAELTTGLPPAITAATGIDALTHAIEAYVGLGTHPFADMFALSAIARVGNYLKLAVEDGNNLRARHEMLLAASAGAIAFQKTLGACHALAHPLSAVAGLHHGLANALMLPHVIRFNLDSATARYAAVDTALSGHRSGTVEDRAAHCEVAVSELIDAVGLPTRLRDFGVKKSQFKKMVPQALADACAPGNPRLLTVQAAKALYQAAY
jgi:4-hydroxybutyrate dehydrogenase